MNILALKLLLTPAPVGTAGGWLVGPPGTSWPSAPGPPSRPPRLAARRAARASSGRLLRYRRPTLP